MLDLKTCIRLSLFLVTIVLLLGRCSNPTEPDKLADWPSRTDKIPQETVKMTSDMDLFPPVLHSDVWQEPVPMEGPVNTAGAEDAPVITSDGKTFFFLHARFGSASK